MQRHSNSTTGGAPLTSQKPPLDPSYTSAKSKRVRISHDDPDNPTEDESDRDLGLRRLANVSDEDDDDDDNEDDDDESLPPLPPPLFRSQEHLAGSKQQTAVKTAHPQPSLAASKPSSSTRPPSRTSTNPTASTSFSSSPTATLLPFGTATYLARNPPLSNPSKVNALTDWALQLAQQQAQGLSSAAFSSRLHQPSQNTTTVDHIARAIAGQRSQLNGVSSRTPQSPSSQPS